MANISGRRRGFLAWVVEPYKQIKIGLIFVCMNMFFAALFFFVVGYFFLDVYKALSGYFQLTEAQGNEVMGKLKLPIFMGFGLIVLFLLSSVLASLKYTHAIYGPLVSIHRYIDDVLQGDKPDRLALRDRDELKALAEKINLLAEPWYQPSKKFSDKKH